MKENVRFGVIGSGSFGSFHMGWMKHVDNAELVANCDKHMDIAEEASKKYGTKAYYDDYNKMLADEDLDAVIVATSDQAHAEATIAALKAGKHVLCEKPMSLYLDECREMIKVADETGQKLMVGQICRYTPGFVKAKELIDQGIIGELFYVESEYAHDYALARGVDSWRVHKDREPIIGGACHAIDLLRWIAGDPVETMAYGNHKMLTDWPVNDCTVAIFKFPDNVIGKVFTSIGCKRNYTMRTVLYGSKGTIIVNNKDPYLSLYLSEENFDNKVTPEAISNHTIEHKVRVSLNDHNGQAEQRAFVDSILNETPILMTAREGAKTVAACCAVVESVKTGQAVKIEYDF